MILKVFKEKSNIKYLNKRLSNRIVNVDNRKVKTLGVILNIDEFDNFNVFKDLADLIKIQPNKLKIIAFSASKKENVTTLDAYFTPNDLGWKDSIKNVELQSFLDENFDALISYYTKDNLTLKMLTVLSKSQFKIGILQTDARVNDLIIKASLNEFDVFKNEVFKYLTILNKI